jgi:hypothetical protein
MSCLHSSNYGAAVSAFVVVLVLVLNKILIHEDEHEDEYGKNQIRSYAHALSLFLFSAFPPGVGPSGPEAAFQLPIS